MAFPFDKETSKKVANKVFTPSELDQMRSMLDDPNVSKDDRKNFLYALSNAGRLNDADIDKYASQVGADAGDVEAGGTNVIKNLNNAKDSIPGAHKDQENARVKKDKEDIKNAQAALGQGGYSNSNEIVDQGEKGLKLFDDFYPLYQQAGGQDNGAGTAAPPKGQGPVTAAPAAKGGGSGAPSGVYSHTGVDPTSLRAGMDEFRDIDFTAFHADAQTLKTADGAVGESTEALNKAWGANTGEWQGDAKAAAQEQNSVLVKAAGTISQAMRTAPDDIISTIDSCVRENVVRFCNEILGLYGDGKIADMTTTEVQGALQVKQEFPNYIKSLDDKIKELDDRSWFEKMAAKVTEFFSGFWGFIVGGPVVWFVATLGMKLNPITPENIKEERDKAQKVLDDANGKLQTFVQDYGTKANSVHEQARTYVQGIQANYDALIETLGKGLDPDPFAATGAGGDQQTPPAGSGGDTGGGGSTGGGSGGGGQSGSGSAGGGAPPPPPAPPPAEVPPKPTEGMNPITGKPLEVDPGTGQPYPIDPKTGEALKGVGDQQETLQVQKGDSTIAMSEPDKDGKMDVSVDDGAGHKHDYKLDFDDDRSDTKADPVAVGKDADPGSHGIQKDDAPGPGGAYQPGPDGKIHIQDGNLKITAERPDGPGGPTVVTVDDGKGEPTKYTLADKTEIKAGEATPVDAKADVKVSDHQAPSTGDVGAGGHGVSDPGDPSAQGPASSHDVVPPQTATAQSGFAGPDGLSLSGDLGVGDTQDTQGGAAGDTSGDTRSDMTVGGRTELTVAASAASYSAVIDDGGASAGLGDSLPVDAGTQLDARPALADDGGLGAAPGGMESDVGQHAIGGAQSDGTVGMMGGMGGAPGGGGDQQRSSIPYRVDGGIFETTGARGRISGSLDDESDRSTK